jgi:hypothetical protein
VELVESCINLLLPRLEVVQHTGRIHRIVTRLAMDLDGAGDVATVLLMSRIVRTTTSLSTLSPGNALWIATLAICLTSCSTPFAKLRMSKAWLRVGLPATGPATPFGPVEPSTGGSVRPRFGSGAAALSVDVLFSFDRERRGAAWAALASIPLPFPRGRMESQSTCLFQYCVLHEAYMTLGVIFKLRLIEIIKCLTELKFWQKIYKYLSRLDTIVILHGRNS